LILDGKEIPRNISGRGEMDMNRDVDGVYISAAPPAITGQLSSHG